MRLRLADLKKSIIRRDGAQMVTPYLLRPRERRDELAALITLYESWLGRERGAFPADRPAEIIGDFRLARCLSLCLGEWYSWAAPPWPEPASATEAAALAAQGIGGPGPLRLALYDEVNQTAGGYLGADDREAWLDAFAAACVPGGLSRATLDALLTLDADDRATLRRLPGVELAPSVAELAARYNQRAVETMLANASAVEWFIPPEVAAGSGGGLGAVVKRICFLARQMGVQYDVAFASAPTTAESADPTPARRERDGAEDVSVGGYDAMRRRRYTDTADVANAGDGAGLARVAERPALYVVGDAANAATTSAQPGFAAPTTLEQARAAVVVTLYGPQEVMGAPNQYGERLARLCRALLGYRRRLGAGLTPQPPSHRGGKGETSETSRTSYNDGKGETSVTSRTSYNDGKGERDGSGDLAPASGAQTAALGSGEGLLGAAQVYLYGRPMTFPLDERLLRLLRAGAAADDDDAALNAANPQTDAGGVAFDSSLERQLYADFTALERAGETAGWRMEREPEPLLIGATILVPDFALTRGLRRVYLEIAGYWRPGYRERKARKLVALRGAAALVVAAPTSARAEFAGLDDAFPFLWYRDNGAINAALLITLIERAYDDFAARLAALDLPRIRAEVALRGRIPLTESMALLHCYTRDEQATAARRLANPPAGEWVADDPTIQVIWLDGVGLCSAAWRDAVVGQVGATLRGAPGGRLALAELRAALARAPQLASADGAPDGALTAEATETLALLAGATIHRASLFAVDVALPDEAVNSAPSVDQSSVVMTTQGTPATPTQSAWGGPAGRRAQPRRGARRKERDVLSVTHPFTAFTQQTFFPPAPTDAADHGASTSGADPRLLTSDDPSLSAEKHNSQHHEIT